MKIQDFCSKIRRDEAAVFQTLRKLQKVETQTLLEGTENFSWDPWARLHTPEPAAA